MRIRDVQIRAVAAGRNWRFSSCDDSVEVVDWEIEPCSTFEASDTVVCSGLTVFEDSEVRAILVNREVGTLEWWGDTCEFVDGAWKQIGREFGEVDFRQSESYAAVLLRNDPSFMGEYSHEKQTHECARSVGSLPV